MGSQPGGVGCDPWGHVVDAYLGRRVGDGDKYGHQDVYEEVSRHHAWQQAHAQQAPVAFAAPAHPPARATHTCKREDIRREEMPFSTDVDLCRRSSGASVSMVMHLWELLPTHSKHHPEGPNTHRQEHLTEEKTHEKEIKT